MLKVLGHIYTDDEKKFDKILEPLTEAGFTIAYDSDTSATIIEEVVENE